MTLCGGVLPGTLPDNMMQHITIESLIIALSTGIRFYSGQVRRSTHNSAYSEAFQNAKQNSPMQTTYFHVLMQHRQCVAAGNTDTTEASTACALVKDISPSLPSIIKQVALFSFKVE